MLPDRLAERLASLEVEVRALTRALDELELELRGAGGVRSRLHGLENDAAAAKVAKATLDAQRAERRAAGAYFDRRAGLLLAALVGGVQVLVLLVDRALP